LVVARRLCAQSVVIVFQERGRGRGAGIALEGPAEDGAAGAARRPGAAPAPAGALDL
jgi:hypothetical protein